LWSITYDQFRLLILVDLVVADLLVVDLLIDYFGQFTFGRFIGGRLVCGRLLIFDFLVDLSLFLSVCLVDLIEVDFRCSIYLWTIIGCRLLMAYFWSFYW
jgi:hypothetical protein